MLARSLGQAEYSATLAPCFAITTLEYRRRTHSLFPGFEPVHGHERLSLLQLWIQPCLCGSQPCIERRLLRLGFGSLTTKNIEPGDPSSIPGKLLQWPLSCFIVSYLCPLIYGLADLRTCSGVAEGTLGPGEATDDECECASDELDAALGLCCESASALSVTNPSAHMRRWCITE